MERDATKGADCPEAAPQGRNPKPAEGAALAFSVEVVTADRGRREGEKAAPAPALAFTDVVTLYHRQLDGVHKLWGYLGLIGVALVTIVWTKDVPHEALPPGVLTVLFLGFALGNGYLLFKEQAGLAEIAAIIQEGCAGKVVAGKQVPEELRPALKGLTAGSGVASFVGIVSLVVALIWLRSLAT